MLVLGIESSCDETGIALYDTEKGLLGHTLHSQVKLHSFYGGVVPELASRDHIKYIIPLIDQLLKDNSISINLIDSIAYTAGPGLSGALLVGSSLAEALAYSLNIPSIPVHHLEGHLLAPMLEDDKPSFPFVALLVSGGHTQLIDVKGIGQYKILGDTLDDAAGEAFDKTAKLLGLGYPGGSALSELADKGNAKYDLPRPLFHTHGLDFSFSGLKTAVLTLVKKQPNLTLAVKANIAFSFQESITDVLVKKSIQALKQTSYNNIVISGGVGANKKLREKLITQSKSENFRAYFPKLEFCTDNGAMIALAGALRAHLSSKNDYKFSVQPRWKLSEIESNF
ncbi:tRNA (adenosine(37)-N6)-threonylcarbamoyltransferase complex transferase subunit TsaD [Methylophilaceae bacterium]|jgi:N6-L-threonylcarbamoyladenine synthase|nr:tRNA (adenosine(37)-N6)-threonylcarbamoyltransferase complex transferase subunit TsaD [Methylophilaceae bacterium]